MAGENNVEARVGFVFDHASVDDFLSYFNARLREIGESATSGQSSFSAGLDLAKLEDQVRQAGRVFGESFNQINLDPLLTRLRSAAREGGSASSFGGYAKQYGFDASAGADRSQVQAGYAAGREAVDLANLKNGVFRDEVTVQEEALAEARSSISAQAVALRKRLEIANQVNAAAEEGVALEKNLVELKARVVVAEEERRQAELAAVERLKLESGALVAASSLRNRQTGAVDPNSAANYQSVDKNMAGFAAAQARATASAERVAAAEAALAAKAQANANATYTQRLQAAFAPAQANGQPADPSGFSTGGQLVANQFRRAAQFIVPGGIGFAVYREMQTSLQEAEKLQLQFAIIKTQLADVGDVGSNSFDDISKSIINVSKETGVAADQVALITRRLAGVFANDQGTPDFTKGVSEAKDALKLAAVSGIPQDEITNDLVAISKSFDENFKEIGDTAVGLAQRFGQSESDIIKFTSALAPTGRELGFTAEQLAGLGAVAEEFSGQTATSLAENFRRVLPSLQQQRDKIFELFERQPATADIGKEVIKSLAAGDGPAVLKELVEGYDKLSDAQQNELARLVGGRREAGALFAVLANGKATLEALGTSQGQFAGDLDSRFAQVSQTVSFQFEQLKRSIEAFGVDIFNSGVGQGLVDIIKALGGIVAAGDKILQFFGEFNDALYGLPGELTGIALGLGAIYKAITVLQTVRTAGLLPSLLGGRGGNGWDAAQATSQTEGGGGPPVVPIPGVGGAFGNLAKFFLADRTGGEASTISRVGAEAVEAGGLAGTLATIGAIAAPVAAIAAVSRLQKTIDDAGKGVDKGTQYIHDQVIASLKAGVAPDEIKRRFAAVNTSLGEDISTSVIGAITGNGIDPAGDAVTQAINEYAGNQAKDTLNAQIAAVQDYNVSDAGINQSLAARYPNIDPKVDPRAAISDHDILVAKDRAKGENDRIQGILNTFNAHPDDAKALADLQQVVAEAQGYSPEEAAAINEAVVTTQAKADALAKGAAANQEITSGALADSIEKAKAAYAAGTGSLGDLVGALQHQESVVNDLINADHAAGADDSAHYKQWLDTRKQISDALSGAAANDEKVADTLAGLQGNDTPDFKIGQAQARLASILANPEVDPSAKIDAALNLADQERQAFINGVNNQLNAYGQPLTALEKQAKFDTGFSFSPEAQKALNEAELLSTKNNDALTDFANQIGEDVNTLRDTVADQMTQYGEDAKTIIENIAFAKAKLLIHDALIRKQQGDLQGYLDDINKIVSLNADAQAIQAAPIVTGSVGADTKASNDMAAAQQARTDAENAANAALDVQEAQAKGDSVRLAQIAQQRAQVAAQFAHDAAGTTAAQAKIIAADRQLVEAQVARDAALRDLAVAQSGDDPIKAAQAAIDNANEAIATAAGPDDSIKAQADLARAQKQMAQAIRASFDAQFDLLIAVDNFNGDSVKAAQDALAKLVAKRSDPLNDTERVALEAQIKSQEGAVAQAQISQGESDIQTQLDLGNITKGQAISQLELLKRFATNQREIDQIDLQIKQLRGQLGQDFKFNLPSVLGLPTLYEARRFNQTSAAGTGYQDNRVQTINIFATTGASADQIAASVSEAVGDPRRNAVVAKRY